MSRSRASAKAAGRRFERDVADWLKLAVETLTGGESFIDRRRQTGSNDKGDISGVRRSGPSLSRSGTEVVIECKDTSKVSLGPWASEAAAERGNADALAGVVVHKRHGNANPADQWVTMTLAEFVALLTGARVPESLVSYRDTERSTFVAETLDIDLTAGQRSFLDSENPGKQRLAQLLNRPMRGVTRDTTYPIQTVSTAPTQPATPCAD